MSSYQNALKEALKAIGLKKLQAEILTIAGVVDEKSSGQVVSHFNSGGVTRIDLNNWKIE